ncbi:uncharacterized protein LOC103313005 [Tribolium castaneum]
MFTLPPLPPKDYVLRDVNQNQKSAQEFTPVALPRITQTNLGKFCAPIQYQENEKLSNLNIDYSVNPQVLERWTDNARAFWVDKPGKNDYFLHDLFKKYSVEVVPSYDVRFKHNERVFYRSFNYELECMEERRLKKLYDKMDREEREENEKKKMIEEKHIRNTDVTMGLKKCKDIQPFWWNKDKSSESDLAQNRNFQKRNENFSEEIPTLRWQEEPSLTEYLNTDPCKRRYDMALNVKILEKFYVKMERLATENLFLLEFLVDDVKMEGKCDCDTPPGEHCVSFQFLDNDALDVCEADFSPGRKYGKEDNTKSGKSCLFSLTPEQVQKVSEVFDVTVTVFKKMQPGWLPDKIAIGSALISIANLFVELIQSVEVQADQTPSAKTMKDTFVLMDSTGSKVGKISIYIRMSCFGKLIVTQFQMNLEDKSVLFKDKGGQSLYRYKKASKKNEPEEIFQNPLNTPWNSQCPTIPCDQPDFNTMGFGGQINQMYPPQPQPNLNCPMTPCFPDGMFPQDMMMGGGGGNIYGMPTSPQSDMFSPMGQSMLPCSECNIMMQQQFSAPQQLQQQQQQQIPCMMCPPEGMTSQMLTPCEECGTLLAPQFKAEVGGSPSGPASDPPGNYQEIGASMGGNALTIRVHKDKNRIEQVDSVVGSEGSCCCSPGNIGVKKQKQTVSSQSNAGSSPPQCFDVRPGIQQGDKNLPFSFKMSGAGASPNNNVIINPPVCTKPDGTKFTEITDPNKEMFVLRIGKKSEGVQKKANLELELCTPRGPELKPIPRKETRDSQYDPADCKGAGDKKKKGKKGKKDKKGKGKGKGKGKKGKKGKKK